MITLRDIRTLAFVVLAGSMSLAIAAQAGSASRGPEASLTRPVSADRSPGDDGFIQRWLILEPIPANGLTDSAVQAAVKKEYFPDQLAVIPRDGDKVTVDGTELKWHAVDTNDYNVNLHYFAYGLGKPATNALFWAVTIINCPQETPDVRLAIGSNAASVWWVNGQEEIAIYGDRQTVIDDGVSKRLTLKRGPNVLRCAIINGGGATDFCARFLDAQDKPLKEYTISLAQTGSAATGGFGRGGFPRQFGPPGPPAPVPPEVTMLRPTLEEVTRINGELEKFINTNKSASKDLLKKYASLLLLQVPRDNPCIRPVAGVRGMRHDAFVETAKTGDFDILFDGDSITDLWSVETDRFGNPGGKRIFDKYFGDVKVANFGVSGDTTQGILWGLQNGEGQGHKPKAVMLMIGTNSTGNASGPEIAEGVGAVVLALRKDFPDAKILLLAIFPRGAGPTDSNRLKIDEVNKIIARLDDQKHVFFMNINSRFLDEKGGLIGFRADNLHPVEEGYEIWASAVAPILKSWVK
jgi:lysophospholipase L1-like esterase